MRPSFWGDRVRLPTMAAAACTRPSRLQSEIFQATTPIHSSHWFTASMHCTETSDLCIPRNETAGPHSQFVYSCICKGFIYSQDWVCLFGCSKIGMDRWLQIHECGNWETEHYNSVLEKRGRKVSFLRLHKSEPEIYYWILPGPSFAVHVQ